MKRATRRNLYAIAIVGWIGLSVYVWIRIFDETPDAWNELDRLVSEVPASPRNISVDIAPDLRVTGIQAGIVRQSDAGRDEFVPQLSVPNEPGQIVGWIAWLETPRTEISWEEVFHFTSAGPDQFVGVGEDSRLDVEANQVVTNRTTSIRSDAIANFWVITEGDPPGPLSFEVAIEGVPIRTLDMNLQAPSLPESF